jgi:two-component system NtrC family response regulator
LQWLQTREWPGNVRQLKAVVESAGELVLPEHPCVDADLLRFASGESTQLPEAPQDAAQDSAQKNAALGSMDAALLELETRMIREAMAQSGGNQSEAARVLGISRVGLIKKLTRLGLR